MRISGVLRRSALRETRTLHDFVHGSATQVPVHVVLDV